MVHNIDLGRFGEELAAGFLAARGCEVVDKNWRCSAGEVDLVAVDKTTVVFVEVKTRTSVRYGAPIGAISVEKLRRMHRVADAWLGQAGLGRRSHRVDVVGIVLDPDGSCRVDHIVGLR